VSSLLFFWSSEKRAEKNVPTGNPISPFSRTDNWEAALIFSPETRHDLDSVEKVIVLIVLY
jgi:hypothetical protein